MIKNCNYLNTVLIEILLFGGVEVLIYNKKKKKCEIILDKLDIKL